MVKLVDTPDLGSGAEMCGGSSPSTRNFIFQLFRFVRIRFNLAEIS